METEQVNTGGKSTITNEDRHIFAEGTIVQVQARTWPGINKPGGIGRITHVRISDDKVTDVDVHYIVLGGRERRVPIQYVKLAPEYVSSPSDIAANQLRDRSIMLGRCKRCGSLRADCGSCDWMEQERLAEHARNQPASMGVNVNVDDDLKSTIARKKRRKIAKAVIDESISSSSDDSSDEDLFEQMHKVRRRRPRYNQEKVQWRRLLRDSSSESSRHGEVSHDESSLSSSDPEDSILAKLAKVTRQKRRSKAHFLELKYAKAKEKRRQRRTVHTTVSTLKSRRDSSRTAASSKPMMKPPTAPLTSDSIQFSSPEVSPRSQRAIEESEHIENVGDPDLSPPPSPNSDQSEEIGTSAPTGNKFENQKVYAPDVSLDLEGVGFIQPEGVVAAGHLPQDIVDRTLSVSFKDLPSFFDELVMELEDYIIPNAKLTLSEFEHRSRELQSCNDSLVMRQSKEER